MCALEIDGSWGEGGGQILRTSLSLACITGRAIDVVRIRAGRPRPGLAAQHLAAVRAAAALCAAKVRGAELGAKRLRFSPQRPVEAGEHVFDVSAERKGGSAGSTSLVLQTVALPLSLAAGESQVVIRGGTHTAWSPPYDYVEEVWAPTLARMALDVRPSLRAVGWYPEGGGEVAVRIAGRGASSGAGVGSERPSPIELLERGSEERVRGRAITSRLPDHVGRRLVENARRRLEEVGLEATLDVERVEARGPGAGLFLTFVSSGRGDAAPVLAGSSALGERGKLAEVVAAEAVEALLAHRASGAPVDVHLADQLVLPAALASGSSRYRVAAVSRHLTTNLWVVERFGIADVEVVQDEGTGTGLVVVRPRSDGVQ